MNPVHVAAVLAMAMPPGIGALLSAAASPPSLSRKTRNMMIDIASIVPGGIRASDHVHVGTNDGACSRCRRPIREDEVPIQLFIDNGHRMLIYCNGCDGSGEAAREW